MSSISSIGAGISQFVQSLVSNNASAASSNSSSGTTTSTASHHHHHHAGGFEKLADAVTSALQSAASGTGSTSTSDANKTITDALTKIFKNGSLGGADDSDATDDTDSTANNATTGSVGTTSTDSLKTSFQQVLQSFGVTAKQFQSDLASALKTAQQSGTADVGAALKSFPTGSFLNAVG